MNRLNPAYIALFLAVILIVVIWQDRKFQKVIEVQQERLYQLEQVGQKVAALKNYWDKKNQKKRVEDFIRFAKKFIKKQDQRGNRVHLYLDGMDAKNADRVADKLLNSFIKVKSIKIDRKNKEQISMEMELAF